MFNRRKVIHHVAKQFIYDIMLTHHIVVASFCIGIFKRFLVTIEATFRNELLKTFDKTLILVRYLNYSSITIFRALS